MLEKKLYNIKFYYECMAANENNYKILCESFDIAHIYSTSTITKERLLKEYKYKGLFYIEVSVCRSLNKLI